MFLALPKACYLRLLVLMLSLSASVALGDDPQERVEDGVGGILAAFDHHPLVVIGEWHSLKPAGDFYITLVRSPGFAAKVNDIVVEFASQNSQPVLDRYIDGKYVSTEELSSVWRNTTKTLSWESPIYADLLVAVRDINQRLPAQRRLRVVAGDAPIDWTKVQTHDQWEAFQPNDRSFANVIDREVLSLKRRALVILGGNHVTKNGDRSRKPNTTTLLNDKHPNAAFIVLLWGGSGSQDKAAFWKAPALIPVKNNRLTDLPRGSSTLGEASDAVLYLGDESSLVTAQPHWDRLDAEYLKEVDRRHRIQFGCPLDLDRWKRNQRPCP